MTQRIISQKELKRILHYCPETGVFTWLVSRGRISVGTIAGATNNLGYCQIGINKTLHLAHRLAWLYMTGEFPSDQIDHLNHVRDDNAWPNLRGATQLINSRNTTKRSDNKSGIVGVCFVSRENKWLSFIHHDGKCIHLGYFNCITAAAIARKAAEIKYGYHVNHGS